VVVNLDNAIIVREAFSPTPKRVGSDTPAPVDNLMTTSPPPVKTSVGQKIKNTVPEIRESVVRGSPRAGAK
jgi:hypothetical protein